jgi:hypothetical protein
MAQQATFHVSEVADRPSAATDANIPEPNVATAKANGASNLHQQLQPPVLAAGEKVEDFWLLAAEVWDALQPKTFLERLEVSDVCHALWEERRYRRQQGALPTATRLKALECLLAANGYEKIAIKIAMDYFGRNEEERATAIVFLDRLGITNEAIAAQASEHNLATISAMERLMANRQSRRDMIVKQYQRRKRKAEKHKADLARQPEPARRNDNSAPPKKDAA